jgi:hypothetical protein
MNTPPIALVVLTLVTLYSTAQAQTAPPALPRFDVTASSGWYSARETGASEYDSWYGQSLSRSVAAGYYWTEHWKTDVDVGWTGRGQLYGEHPDASPASLTYGSARHSYSTVNIALVQHYQFGHNAMFHPDIAAGAMLEWVRHGGELGPLFGRNGTQIQPRRPIPPSSERRPGAFVSSGFKAYLSERLFLRTDLRVGFRREVAHVLLNAAVGLDF